MAAQSYPFFCLTLCCILAACSRSILHRQALHAVFARRRSIEGLGEAVRGWTRRKWKRSVQAGSLLELIEDFRSNTCLLVVASLKPLRRLRPYLLAGINVVVSRRLVAGRIPRLAHGIVAREGAKCLPRDGIGHCRLATCSVEVLQVKKGEEKGERLMDAKKTAAPAAFEHLVSAWPFFCSSSLKYHT